MRFAEPLIRATLLRRYKRFLADVRFDSGESATVHVANPGSMLGLAEPGMEVWLSRAANPERKLAWNLELVRAEGTLVGINTVHPNRLAAEALDAGAIRELRGYASRRAEVRYGRDSRIDLLLEDPQRPPCYLEVKNVHFKRNGAACFPDSVTARGAKHLIELAAMARRGARAAMLFLVQRSDCDRLTLAEDVDPAYAAAFDRARERGVEMLCYACRVTTEAITVERRLPIRRRALRPANLAASCRSQP